MGDSPKAFIAIVAAFTLIGVIVYSVWLNSQRNPEIQDIIEISEETTGGSLGEELFNEVETPADALPDINPISADTNPFGDAAVNPFEGLNPFEAE